MYKLLLAIIISVFFPVYIRFQGLDAATTGTVAICFLFAYYFVVTSGVFRKTYFPLVVFCLIVFGLISAFSLDSLYYGPSFRRYLGFVAGLLLFFLVINLSATLSAREQQERIEYLLTFILILYSIQIIVGIAVYFAPQLGTYLSIFTTREYESLETKMTDGVKRMSSIILGRESVGEIVAVLTPLILYKVLVNGKKFYYLVLGLFFVGVVLSATRSGFLLFIFATALYALSVLPMIKLPTWALFVSALILGLPLAFVLFPDIFVPIIERFGDFLQVYSKTDSLAQAANRQGVWHYIVIVLFPKLSLFGNGFVSIYKGTPFDFHNLYATVLHRFGVVGFPLFFYIFYKILSTLYRSRKYTVFASDKALVNACLVAVLVLLINEVKFDFIRKASYQQSIWLLLGVFYLVGLYVQKRHQEGREDVVSSEKKNESKLPRGLLARYRAEHDTSAIKSDSATNRNRSNV